ncbi:MAG TPA: peptidase S9, prolyl oligopeptidase [Verrucomicrobiales bacterium]|nr:peptidase S9, prolyl oligopeptidase [Verrucomicrobiales bacterium]
MLINTRFAETPQLHWVSHPGGARRQLTFASEPVRAGAVRPVYGDSVLFSQDTGGGEFFQLYRLDLKDGQTTLLTDGKSRHTGARWSHTGRWIAYSSTERNGQDTDLYVMDPTAPAGRRRVLEVKGGGWGVEDWSWDDRQLLVSERVSINETWLYRLDIASGKREPLFDPASRGTPGKGAAFGTALFDREGRHVYWTTDGRSEFHQLFRVEIATLHATLLSGAIPWDIEEAALSPDGRRMAVLANERGSSVLYLLDPRSGGVVSRPRVPAGVVGGILWHESGRELGFTLSSARAPGDAYSLDVRSGALSRWTESETGGLDATRFAEPELVRVKSFDGLEVSGFLYRPDPARHPGPRPVLLSIHGGPESQSRPVFQARNNYLVEELGVALLLPNVRGSSGYGKTYLTLDDGFKREDSVKDIGAFLDWIAKDPRLDPGRVGVMGGSYGGYMALACMEHYNDRLRCGIDVVGISNFLSFLKNTQDYRRDLRRVEYGDERDPGMAEFLQRISPTTQAARIRKPLFVVQGKNDPRVPVTESEQMVKAIRDQGGTVWYLMARDEGHGFAKKRNADFQFLASLLFFREHLLKAQ